MWPAKSIMQSMRPAMLCRFSTPVLQHVNFQKFSDRGCPRTPLEPFLLLNQLQICFAEKNTLEKNVEIIAHPFLKFLATPQGL